jgi:DNA-binding XRE family transcriptional regulator
MDVTLDEKCDLVRRLIRGEPVEALAKETGIPKANLLGWRERYEEAGRTALMVGDWASSDTRKNPEAVALGGKLKLFRHLAGYESQAHLARLVGVKRTDMTDYETGRRTPEERICRELAKQLLLNVKFLDSSLSGPMPTSSVFSEKVVLYSVRFPRGTKTPKDRFLDLLSLLVCGPEVDRIYASGRDYMLVLRETYVFLRCHGPVGPSVAHLLEKRNRIVSILPTVDEQSRTKDEEVIKHFLEAHQASGRVSLDTDSLVDEYVQRCTKQTCLRDSETKTKTMQAIYDLMKRRGITLGDIKDAIAKQ